MFFYAYKEQWINYELITKFLWPNADYKSKLQENNIPLHKTIRTIISSIRTKKLKPGGLDKKIIFQSGETLIGADGEGWFRLHFIAR